MGGACDKDNDQSSASRTKCENNEPRIFSPNTENTKKITYAYIKISFSSFDGIYLNLVYSLYRVLILALG